MKAFAFVWCVGFAIFDLYEASTSTGAVQVFCYVCAIILIALAAHFLWRIFNA